MFAFTLGDKTAQIVCCPSPLVPAPRRSAARIAGLGKSRFGATVGDNVEGPAGRCRTMRIEDRLKVSAPRETMQTKHVPEAFDTIAPDGSEIRILVSTAGSSMAHCSLPPGRTSLAVAHRTVEEVWYFLGGRGEVWRKLGDSEETVEVSSGSSLSIPRGTHFQFRNTAAAPLEFVLTTIPQWPGHDEAYRVPGCWPTGEDCANPRPASVGQDH